MPYNTVSLSFLRAFYTPLSFIPVSECPLWCVVLNIQSLTLMFSSRWGSSVCVREFRPAPGPAPLSRRPRLFLVTPSFNVLALLLPMSQRSFLPLFCLFVHADPAVSHSFFGTIVPFFPSLSSNFPHFHCPTTVCHACSTCSPFPFPTLDVFKPPPPALSLLHRHLHHLLHLPHVVLRNHWLLLHRPREPSPHKQASSWSLCLHCLHWHVVRPL